MGKQGIHFILTILALSVSPQASAGTSGSLLLSGTVPAVMSANIRSVDLASEIQNTGNDTVYISNKAGSRIALKPEEKIIWTINNDGILEISAP